ncbi:MAG: bifunctional D-altronate/D-mannonate dehydratase [Tannerella sp.]|nr:bifunctional D-altronate/D-mannonate dehydratase [Tannerella sp.]
MNKEITTNRRNFMKTAVLGSAAGLMAIPELNAATPYATPNYAKAMAPVKIKNCKAIATRPGGSNLIVVKVETTEPGLYGVGCATFTQRAFPVVTAIEQYMNEFCVGRDVDNIEDMWQAFYVSSYWRNGPVLNNAISGLDQALWDIKGKRAGMPVYQLLGGKCRFAVPLYAHASGRTIEDVVSSVKRFMDQGFKHIRIQMGGYGGVGTGTGLNPDFKAAGFGLERDGFMDEQAYIRGTIQIFEAVRKACGDEIELLHDIHERLQPMDVIYLCKQLEQYRPFFIEDPLSPENTHWWKQLRESTTVPFAMGELFNNINEFVQPMVNHYFDFIRIHISQIGGITPAMKVARLGEWFNVRTAWHGPGDVSPVGHAANAHISLATWNFGILEGGYQFRDNERVVFPGTPTHKDGMLYVNEAPGLGVDVDEKEAAKFPINNSAPGWTIRRYDGTIIRP